MRKKLRNLYNRFVSKTPAAFAWIRNVALFISGLTGTLSLVPNAAALLEPYLTYGAIIGAGVGFVCQFATKGETPTEEKPNP